MITMTLPATIVPDDMKNLVNHFPQLLTCFELNKSIRTILNQYVAEGVTGICFIGMGGSSIAGNYVRSLLNEISEIPIIIVREYKIPAFVTSTWVVIAVSYSGNTEETLSALAEASEKNTKIIRITSGGKMAQDKNQSDVILPGGIQPRATLPLMLSVALPIAEIVVGLRQTEFNTLESILANKAKSWGEEIQSPSEIASLISKRIPLLIGAEHLKPVAYRTKCQINENSKALAFYSELPESNHNEIEGFVTTHGCSILPIFLRSGFESKELRKRFDATYDIYREMSLEPMNLKVTGRTKLEEMLLLTHLLDMVSVELSYLHKVDPVSVDVIQDLKHRLSKD